MITKAKIFEVRQLHQKKFRDELNNFIVEGTKSVVDLFHSSLTIRELYASQAWLAQYGPLIPQGTTTFSINDKEMGRISCLKNPQQVLAVAAKPIFTISTINFEAPILVLDDIRDPGNLGTMIRTADWFGITQIVCSDTTVEFTNPKTIQATMGSFSRIDVYYTDLSQFLAHPKITGIIYGTFMEGKSIEEIHFKTNDLLVIGNESNGISAKIEKLVSQKIHIPSHNPLNSKAESLNASIAAAIAMYNFSKK